MYNQIKTLIRDFNKVQEEFKVKMKNCFEEIFKEFFEAYPEVKKVYWLQYTPYFNDGEPCVFSVGEIGFSTNENYSGDYYESDPDFPFLIPSDFDNLYKDKYPSSKKRVDAWNSWSDTDRQKIVAEGVSEFQDFLRSIPSNFFLEAFQDHSRVSWTKNGVDIEEFGHD